MRKVYGQRDRVEGEQRLLQFHADVGDCKGIQLTPEAKDPQRVQLSALHFQLCLWILSHGATPYGHAFANKVIVLLASWEVYASAVTATHQPM